MDYPLINLEATGQRIKELRQQKCLRVEDVRDFMGFESGQAVYKWQRGESLPTVENLYALSSLFGTTIDDILRGDKEEGESPLLPRLKRLSIIPQRYFRRIKPQVDFITSRYVT